jgi:mannonate dehydratase
MKAIGATALTGSITSAAAVHVAPAQQKNNAGRDTPKICMGCSSRATEADMRRLKQLGVDYVLMGGPAIPWQESAIRSTMDRLKQGGQS